MPKSLIESKEFIAITTIPLHVDDHDTPLITQVTGRLHRQPITVLCFYDQGVYNQHGKPIAEFVIAQDIPHVSTRPRYDEDAIPRSIQTAITEQISGKPYQTQHEIDIILDPSTLSLVATRTYQQRFTELIPVERQQWRYDAQGRITGILTSTATLVNSDQTSSYTIYGYQSHPDGIQVCTESTYEQRKVGSLPELIGLTARLYDIDGVLGYQALYEPKQKPTDDPDYVTLQLSFHHGEDKALADRLIPEFQLLRSVSEDTFYTLTS